jgi:flagellar basal-body rod modification protein FlgD
MNVNAVTSALNSSQTGTQTTRKTSLTQEDFMNLFTTQMKFQNPLEPLDNYQMATQLSQFNTVDALAKMNETLNQLTANQTSLNNLQASSLLGKKIEVKGNNLSIQQGAVSGGVYQLARPGNVIIQVFNSSGNLVRQIQPGWKDTSAQAIGWDGKSQSGATLPDGIYSFRVLAADQKGQAVPVTAYRVGTVDGVSFENGTAYFQLGGDKVNFSDILSILN